MYGVGRLCPPSIRITAALWRLFNFSLKNLCFGCLSMVLTPSGHFRIPTTGVTLTSPEDWDDEVCLAAFNCAIFGIRDSGKRTENTSQHDTVLTPCIRTRGRELKTHYTYNITLCVLGLNSHPKKLQCLHYLHNNVQFMGCLYANISR